MNTDQFKGKWVQFKGEVKKQWGKLTDDDLMQGEGVLLVAADAELARQHLGGLPHVEPTHDVREPLEERDARREQPGAEARQVPRPR